MKLKLVFIAVFLLTFCISAYGVEVSVSELFVEPGDTITVEISIDDAAGFASADIILKYDPAILEVKDTRRGALAEEAGFLMIANPDILGEISFAMALFPGMTEGSGAILAADFEVKAAEPDISPLILSKVILSKELGEAIEVTIIDGSVNVQPPGPPVVKEHTPGSLILALEATYDEADVPGYTYVDIWADEMLIEEGMFLEFQVKMFSGNPTFKGTVDLHTSDDANLRDSESVDQNGLSAHPDEDLSQQARDMWYHRTISLDALAGETLDGAMIATESSEHSGGIFRVYVDNIQITDGTYVLLTIYSGEETVPITGEITATDVSFAGVDSMSNYQVSVVGATAVAPVGKLVSSWGSIKNSR